MTALSPDERAAVREAIDERRRALIDDAGGYAQVEAAERHATRGPTANGQFSARLKNRLAAEALDVLEAEQEEPALVEGTGRRTEGGTRSLTRSQPTRPLDEDTLRRRNPTQGRTRRCGYCGLPSASVVCRAHRDLL